MPSEPIVVEGPSVLSPNGTTHESEETAQTVQLHQALRDLILSRHRADQEGFEDLLIDCVEHLKRGKICSILR